MEVWEAVTIFILVVLVLGAGLFYYFYGIEPVLRAWGPTRDATRDAFRWLAENVDQYFASLNAQREERRREKELGIELAVSPAIVLDNAVREMVNKGYSLEHRTADSASFVREEGANGCLGCLLLLLFLLPGILYLLLARSTRRVSVVAYPHEVEGNAGTRLVIGGDDGAAIGGLVMWARHQTPFAGEVHAESGPGQSIADRLQELDRLRKHGHISEEEYRTSRARILGEL